MQDNYCSKKLTIESKLYYELVFVVISIIMPRNILIMVYLYIILYKINNYLYELAIIYIHIPWPTLSSIRRCLILIISLGGKFFVNCATSS